MNKQIFLIFYGAGSGAQTRDLRLGKATLDQLSHSRIFWMVRMTGLEPARP